MAMALVVPQRLVHLSLVDSIIIVFHFAMVVAIGFSDRGQPAHRPQARERTERAGLRRNRDPLRTGSGVLSAAGVLGGGGGGGVRGAEYYVLVRDHACRGIDFDLVFHWNFAVRKRPAASGSDLLLHFRLGR